MNAAALTAILLLSAQAPSSAWAWEKHRSLMPWAMESFPPESALGKLLDRPISPFCPDSEKEFYATLSRKLGLNPATPPAAMSPGACKLKASISGREILLAETTNEPDQGMDQNLDDSQDPRGFRKWMGGKTGPTSQGFRHMYFGGWKILHPLTTFQVPPGPLGYAPERAEAFAREAREQFRAGNPGWGFRLLGWAMHYLQDLAQPFHSVQLPSLRMAPWHALLNWPPQEAFHELVRETTRTIGNYHFAYEEYVETRLAEDEKTSPFSDCLVRAESLSTLAFDPKRQGPLDLAHAIAHESIQLAPYLGRAEVAFFGAGPKQRGVDIPAGKGAPDYRDYAIRPDLSEPRSRMHAVSCQALSNAIQASRYLVHWALAP